MHTGQFATKSGKFYIIYVPIFCWQQKVVKKLMVFVKVRDAEHLEEAIKRFKRECEKNGILKEIKRRETYMPPSVKRKIKSQEAQRRARRTKRRRY